MARKLAVAAIAALLPLLLLELSLRAAAVIESRWQSRAFATLESESPPRPGERVELARLLRASDNPRLLYELRPGLSVVHKGQPVHTDARGFRVSGAPVPRTADPIRILGLGDSVMFGWGVADSEVFLVRLAHHLSRRFPGSTWQAINTGVPGYNTTMEVETLLAKGLRPPPDLVILAWVSNDLDLPNFLRPSPPALALDRSFAHEWARLRMAGLSTDPFEDPIVRLRRKRDADEESAYVSSLSPAHRALVGLDALDRAAARLAEAASSHDFEVVVVSARGRPPRVVRERFAKLGFILVTTTAARRRWLREGGFDRATHSTLVLSTTDPHPSPLGHELLATALTEHFVESGLARRLLARRPVAGRD